MDPKKNPFSPGSGSNPPVLAGRDEVLNELETAFDRVKNLRSAQNYILTGLRGVGKTVLLRTAQNIAVHSKMQSLIFEADANRPLRSQIASRLRQILINLDFSKKVNDHVWKGLRVLAGFAQAAKVKHGELELALDFDPLLGTADTGNIGDDLPDLFEAVGKAAQSQNTAIILIIDEMHELDKNDLVALIMAMHRVSQHSLPMLLLGGGLPHLTRLMGAAKGYAERLFKREEIDALKPEHARLAIQEPLSKEGCSISKAALDEILSSSLRYPYFLQEWGKQAWNCANGSTIDIRAARAASPLATSSLDDSFFRFRIDQLTDKEKRYARAMAELGEGPYKTGDVAEVLGNNVKSLAPIRESLIKKGTIHPSAYGETAFTVPLFHRFMLRAIPSLETAKPKPKNTPRNRQKTRSKASRLR